MVKDLLRTIARSKARFLSILAIIMLGTGFFAGITATEQDMKLSADRYFENTRLADFHIIDPIGFTFGEIEKVKAIRDVESVQTGYSKDVFLDSEGGSSSVVRVFGYYFYGKNDQITIPRVVSGRMPVKSGEIAIDYGLHVPEDIKLGSTMKITLPKSDKVSDSFETSEFRVVGFVQSPEYFSLQRGQTNIGGGTIDFIAYIFEKDFKSETPTDLLVRTSNPDSFRSFTAEYDEYAAAVKTDLEDLATASMARRIGELRAELGAKKAELESKKAELAAARLMFGEADPRVAAASSQIASAQAEIAAADDRISQIPESWIVLGRSDNPGYSDYGEDALRVGQVAKVVPLFFFLVAALVCLTTMTRMIEEERTEIGTLKALGFSAWMISSKYLIYALASSLFGAIAGLLIGYRLFPLAIMNAYSIMYKIPIRLTPWHAELTAVSLALSVVTTVTAALMASISELASTPAALIQPRAPKPGKRVFLERVKPLWSRLSFLQKVTARNLLRYRLRFYMTVLGIAGCTALLVTGFGLKDSVNDILDIQFVSIFKYDGHVVLNPDKPRSERDLTAVLGSNPAVRSFIGTFVETGTAAVADSSGKGFSANLTVPEDIAAFGNFIDLHTRAGKAPVSLTGSGAAIDEKLSELLHAGVGDTIEYIGADYRVYRIYVAAVVENYVYHYIYMSPAYYNEVFGHKAEMNSGLFTLVDPVNIGRDAFQEQVMANPEVLAVSLIGNVADRVRDALNSLNFVVLILILSAGALAMVVLYNLTNINITERVREISTIKVLGFRDGEVSAYVYRENMILSLLGTLLGILLGYFLHKYVMATMEINTMMFGKNVHAASYVYSVLLTLLFAVLVNWIMYYKLRRIDMVESLKSVD